MTKKNQSVFFRSQRGGLSVFTALLVVPLLGVALLSLEAVSTLQATTRLKASSAVISLLGAKQGRHGMPTWSRPGLQNIFEVNMQETGLDALPHPDFFRLKEEEVFSWSALQPVRRFYASLFASPLTNAVLASERPVHMRAEWRARKTEYVLVLDESDTFAKEAERLSHALENFVRAVFAGEEESDDTWVSFIGFSAKVNIGNLYADPLLTPESRKVPPELSKGYSDHLDGPAARRICVYKKGMNGSGKKDKQDYIAAIGHPPKPSEEGFALHVLAGKEDAAWLELLESGLDRGDPKTQGLELDKPEESNPENPGLDDDPPADPPAWTSKAVGSSIDCGQPMLIASSRAQDVLERIRNIQTPKISQSHADEGLAWGYRALAPEWRKIWASNDAIPSEVPAAWDESAVDKKMIFISDGGFGDGKAGPYANPGSDSYVLPELCAYIKDRGIELIMVIYGEDFEDRKTRKDLRNCASPGQYYEEDASQTVEDILLTLVRRSYRVRVSAR